MSELSPADSTDPKRPPAASSRPLSVWRRLLVGLLVVGAVVTVAAAVVVWRVASKVQDTPAFYLAASQVEPDRVDEEAEAVVESVETILRPTPPIPIEAPLDTDVAAVEELAPTPIQTLQFTEAQLNALLARSEPQLPPEVTAPRVRLLADHAVLGARVRRGRREAVVALDLIPSEPRETEVDLIVNRTTAGTMTLPITQVVQLLGPNVLPADLPIDIDEDAGTLAIHLDWGTQRPDVHLEAIRLTDGMVEVDLTIDPTAAAPPGDEAAIR